MPVRWGVVLPLEERKEGVHVLGHMPSYMPAAVTAKWAGFTVARQSPSLSLLSAPFFLLPSAPAADYKR